MSQVFRPLKIAKITFAAGFVLSFVCSQANAAPCAVQPQNRNVTANCYYLPTVSNGRVTGLQQQTSYTFSNGYRIGRGPGAIIGNPTGRRYY